MPSKKVTPFLWFEKDAVKAAKFYVSLFKNSRILRKDKMSVLFQLDGREYIAFNGGPHFALNEAFSLSVSCKNQQEIDNLWKKLSVGGVKSRCGWLKDRFGLWWQIVPHNLSELLAKPGAMEAMLKMDKLIIEKLAKTL